jgi:two-component system, chemotaxis family, sensor kinase CheA
VDREQLIKRLMATFLEELEEHVQALNRDLLALEKDPAGAGRAERLRSLFRTAHSLKGAARSVNVLLIESACHHLEEVLAAVRDGRAGLDAGLFALLFAAADAFEEAGKRLREQPDLTGSPLAGLLPRLEAAAEQAGRPPAPAPAPPPPAQEEPRPVAAAPAPPAPTPTPAPAPPAPAPAVPAEGAGTVRVAADKLDALLARSGELLVARRRVRARVGELAELREAVAGWRAEWRAVEEALRPARGEGDGRLGLPRPAEQALARAGGRLGQLEKDLERLSAALTADRRALDQVAGGLDDEVRRARMLPFDQACQGLDRLAHDLARAGGKEVELVVEGGQVELDRTVLEGLKDPLRHLVRNAIDHGIEPPAQRRAAGKPGRGRVTVSAMLRGGQVEVAVADDGRGLDLEALRGEARRRGLAEPADEHEAARLVFLPGLSTAPAVTDVSGRGVGLDVVKRRAEALHGAAEVSFTPGRGTRFTLAVPLTLTTVRALLAVAAGQTFAVAAGHVERLLRVEPAELRRVGGREVLTRGGAPLPVAALADVLGLRGAARPAGKAPALVLAAGGQRVALLADELLAEQEVVVKSLGARVRRVPHVSGATVLPSGRVALVLNAANLVRGALARAPGPSLPAAPEVPAVRPRKRVLLAEDSVTTRALEKAVLEAAGYEVLPAADGEAAWRLLQEQGADVLVSDVEMPGLDGFGLTEAVRGSARFRDLPVVLVTARETERDKARGVEAGANAYLVKSAFDQKDLLAVIAQLV